MYISSVLSSETNKMQAVLVGSSIYNSSSSSSSWYSINAPSYLLPGDARTRGANRYRKPTTDKDIYKFSFFPRTTTDWNRQLPLTNLAALR
jgi:hypothetical protein